MTSSKDDFEKHLPQLIEGFNKVLHEQGLDGEILKFMIGDLRNPEHIEAQKKLDAMLESIQAQRPSERAFICCSPAGCRICEIA